MKRLLGLALLFSAAPIRAQMAPPAELRSIAYTAADTVNARLDVYRSSAASPAPVLVYFHGGSWTTGARPKAASSFRGFLELGFSVVSVDYRLSDVARAPAAVQDARCAMAWVKVNAARFGFDPERIVAYGTSAGGQLALMTAMLPARNDVDLPQCLDVPHIAAVLDYYGPADVPGFAAKSEKTRVWLGDGAAGEEMGRRLSPLRYVRPGLPPVLIVHGDADPTVPYAQSQQLHAALTAAGVPNRLHTVPGGLHGRFTDDAVRDIIADVGAFLAEQKILPANSSTANR
ncbi:MAG TPA: alpha/beta hydrolase [Longimicrobiaceae bacterium]|jgi:acetyl esterase/lipase|nr:alpha/beta hydrolase [Longimicrobiaceae bacterium]